MGEILMDALVDFFLELIIIARTLELASPLFIFTMI
jgi:hypothetical protein